MTKTIHYCWFGGNPLPESAVKCIASWKKFLPGYEIKEWNESNFDVKSIPYTAEAYEAKKYAFVSDYARFWILYNYGGIYFDTDVEVIRDLEPVLDKGAYMGCETDYGRGGRAEVNPGLGMAADPGHHFLGEMMSYYGTLRFRNPDGSLNTKTIVDYTTCALKRYGLKGVDGITEIAGLFIYPKEYFCPKDYVSNRMKITENTYTIHHYSASWKSFPQKVFTFIESVAGYRVAHFIGSRVKIIYLLLFK